MDYKEVIDWLYDLKHEIRYDEQADAIDIAVECIHKQVPKKPKTILHDGENEWYVCSACGGVLAYNSHHCRCGQAIDWSEVK